ncbi:glycoside hydrolase N-terminal domain-containing protein [Kitasatospora sp. NPDC049258]|uniref:glycosyl hydrolase family 95 catalytic domain-containing protein n=1 Tax=Kitasatospora sp. NPDC049258 TaxID=3155394 RepID=UPI0034181206
MSTPLPACQGDPGRHRRGRTRRNVLKAGGSLAALLAIASVPVFSAAGSETRPSGTQPVPDGEATTLWYTAPATEGRILSEGLPIGNGRLGALVGGDPARDFLHLSDASLWTGTPNAQLDGGGQFPYDEARFGSFQLLAKLYIDIPAHARGRVTDYRRELDLGNGVVRVSYTLGAVTYRREIYISHPDDALVVRLTQSGGGSYTGTLALNSAHGDATTAAAGQVASFGGRLANNLKYAAAVTAASSTGTISATGSSVTFTGCAEVLVVLAGGTNYLPDEARSYMDPAADPKALAEAKARAGAAVAGATLLGTHVADYRKLFTTMSVDLGRSSPAQRALDTASRLRARGTSPGAPDPELEAAYLQFGRYLTITGSRGGLPTNLQGLWLDHNGADQWMGDYHTDINLQMNYWLPDRAGLPSCFDALTDYCLSQLPSWTARTQALFNSRANANYRNSSGKVAGWTTAISANIYGGLGWNWHPAGNAWLCNSLFEHYEYTQDREHLRKIHPVLKGACEFWEARLVTRTITDPATGGRRTVLIDDVDWSPEHGAARQQGITYAQELVWQLFENFRTACETLGADAPYAATVKKLQDQLFLPEVSPSTGYLEEWMQAPDTLGEPGHRHLSPLVGLFPGDRVNPDTAAPALVAGARALLTARGKGGYGWAAAWRSLCWSRLKQGDNAYRAVLDVIGTASTAANLFDMYTPTVFQIDANFGTASAMIEMLVYSRPGSIELLPALPGAWSTGKVTGIGARGGFTVDLAWASGTLTSATIRGAAGTSTVVRSGAFRQTVVIPPSGSVTVAPAPKPAASSLANRQSGQVIDVPGWSTRSGTQLIQWPGHSSANEQWLLTPTATDTTAFTIASVYSHQLISVDAAATDDGTPVVQLPPAATAATNQQWRLADAGGSYVKIINVRSGKLIGLSGNLLVQQTDTGATSQHWRLG